MKLLAHKVVTAIHFERLVASDQLIKENLPPDSKPTMRRGNIGMKWRIGEWPIIRGLGRPDDLQPMTFS